MLIVLLATITAFSVFKYSMSLKEKYDLFNALNQANEQLTVLEQEKQNLLAQLEKEKDLREQLIGEAAELKGNIKATRRRLARLFTEKGLRDKAYEELSYRFSILQAENLALLGEKEQLSFKLSEAQSENEALNAKLGSIKELKQAIREIKIKMRHARIKPKRPEEQEQEEVIQGNRGFLTKDGKSTFPVKIRIEVKPATIKE